MKRFMNHFLLASLLIVLFVSLISLSVAQAYKIPAYYFADGKKQSADVEVQINDKYLYGYLPDNTIVILMYYGKEKSVDIQKDFGEAIVTSINANAFNVFADPYEIDDKFYQVDHGLEHVIVPSTVAYLGEYWFHVHKWSNTVTYNNLPDGLKYADYNSLNYLKTDSIPLWNDIYIADNNFISISVPSKTLTISDDYISIPRGWFGRIFANKIVLPKNLEKIEMSCLNTNDGVTELILPEHLQEIGSFSFRRWAKLKKIWIPASLKSIGEECFSDAPIEEVVFQEGIENIDFSFLRHVNTLKSISLPSTLKVIDSRCFLATGLTNLELPFGTEKIKEAAFKDCNKLVTVRLPGSLTFIADDAFEGCPEKCIFTVDINSYAEKWANEKGYKTKVIIPVTDILLDINTVILNKGKSQTIKASIAPDNSTDKKVEWISSDPAIATVSNGNIKAVACGECDIICKATDGSGVQAVCHVSVIQMVQNIQVKEKKVTVPFGDTIEPAITIMPEDATNKVLEWTSSDVTICTVDANGKITAVGAGDCEISCNTSDGSNKNVKLSVHVPIFDSVESTHSVTEKDGLVIPVDLHGFDLANISHKANNENFFLYYLDDIGLHIFPIKAGKAAITLTNNINKADKAVYNVVVEDTAVYSNTENEPLRAFVVIDKDSVIPGDKIKISYYVGGGTAPYSTCVIDYVTSSRNQKSGGYSSDPLKKLPYGNLTPTVYGGYATDLYYARINVVDANGQMISVNSNIIEVASLDVATDYDIYVAKRGESINLNYRISGGSGQYLIDVKGTIYDNVSGSQVPVNVYNGNSGSTGVIDYIPATGDQFTIRAEVYDQKNKKLMGYFSTPIFVISDEISMRVQYDKEELSTGEELAAYINIDGAETDIIEYAHWYASYSIDSIGITNYEKQSDGIWKATITPAEKGFVQFHPTIKGARWMAESSKWIEVK